MSSSSSSSFFFQRLVAALGTPTAASAFVSTGLISLVPNVLLVLFPALLTTTTPPATTSATAGGAVWWQWGQAMAAGGLLGDVFLHTLPHAMESSSAAGGGRGHGQHDHEHHHDDHHHHDHHHHHHSHDNNNTTGLWILAGFLVFLTLDVLLRTTEDLLHRQHNGDDEKHADANESTTAVASRTTTSLSSAASATTTSWSLLVLNLTADALHNFTDGLAIGASYAAAASAATAAAAAASDGATAATATTTTSMINPGSVATFGILLHEVPHELGDYCTLVAGGYTPWQAVRMQFVTAVAAFVGTAVALFVSSSEPYHDDDDGRLPHDGNGGESVLLLGTAGGFLYLGATTIMPHVLNEPVQKAWHRVGHLAAFCVGLAFMLGVALLEEHGEGDEHHHHHHHGAHPEL